MLWAVAKEAAGNWSRHKDSRQGAALAYYSVFSLGPIIVIAIAVAGFFFGREAVSGQAASSIRDMIGDTGAKAVEVMLADASRPREGLVATLLGLAAVIVAAIGVVVGNGDGASDAAVPAGNDRLHALQPPGALVAGFPVIRPGIHL
jgi:membrane protein